MFCTKKACYTEFSAMPTIPSSVYSVVLYHVSRMVFFLVFSPANMVFPTLQASGCEGGNILQELGLG